VVIKETAIFFLFNYNHYRSFSFSSTTESSSLQQLELLFPLPLLSTPALIMTSTSVKKEMESIRKELVRLQERLSRLESLALTNDLAKKKLQVPKPLPPTCDARIKKRAPTKTSPKTPNKERDRQTLRSRSFKVMRLLINMVDHSHTDTVSTLAVKGLNTTGTPGTADLSMYSTVIPPTTLLKRKEQPNTRSTPIVPKETNASSSLVSKKKTIDQTLSRSKLQQPKQAKPQSPNEPFKLVRYRSIPKGTKVYQGKMNKETTAHLMNMLNVSEEDINHLSIPRNPISTKKEAYQYSGYATTTTTSPSVPSNSIIPPRVQKKLRDPEFAWYKSRWLLLSRPDT